MYVCDVCVCMSVFMCVCTERQTEKGREGRRETLRLEDRVLF